MCEGIPERFEFLDLLENPPQILVDGHLTKDRSHGSKNFNLVLKRESIPPE